eukprot:6213568-Pleurochrysis_carterae.AAC.3
MLGDRQSLARSEAVLAGCMQRDGEKRCMERGDMQRVFTERRGAQMRQRQGKAAARCSLHARIFDA